MFSLLLFPRVDRLSAALGSVSFPQSAQTVSAAEGRGEKTGRESGAQSRLASPLPFKEMSPTPTSALALKVAATFADDT